LHCRDGPGARWSTCSRMTRDAILVDVPTGCRFDGVAITAVATGNSPKGRGAQVGRHWWFGSHRRADWCRSRISCEPGRRSQSKAGGSAATIARRPSVGRCGSLPCRCSSVETVCPQQRSGRSWRSQSKNQGRTPGHRCSARTVALVAPAVAILRSSSSSASVELVSHGSTGATMTLHGNPAEAMAPTRSRRARGASVPGSSTSCKTGSLIASDTPCRRAPVERLQRAAAGHYVPRCPWTRPRTLSPMPPMRR